MLFSVCPGIVSTISWTNKKKKLSHLLLSFCNVPLIFLQEVLLLLFSSAAASPPVPASQVD